MCALLLELGADPAIRALKGLGAVAAAAQKGHVAIVEALIAWR